MMQILSVSYTFYLQREMIGCQDPEQLSSHIPHPPKFLKRKILTDKASFMNSVLRSQFLLSTIAKMWKQMSIHRGMDEKMWYIYTIEYYSAIKKDDNAICNNMVGPRHYHPK